MDNLITNLGERKASLIAIAVALLASAAIMGFAGFKVLAAMMALFIIPTYIILGSLGMERGEHFFMALFLGIIVMPLGAFYLNLVIPSMKLSAAILWVALTGIGIFLFLRKRKSL